MKGFTTLFLIVGVLMMTNISQGQQLVRNNFYVQNPYLINPALTGFHGELSGYLNYRDQWQGIHGAPQMSQIGGHGPISEHMGVGVKGSYLSQGIFREAAVDLTWAYWMRIQDEGSLSLGASIGFAFNRIRNEQVRIQDSNDQALYNGDVNESFFNTGFGIHYEYKAFTLNVASPSLYNRVDKKFLPLVNVETGYDFFVANNIWRIHPAVYYQVSNPGLQQLDFNLLAEWDDLLFGQVGYRTNNSIWLAVGATFVDLGIMYGYEINNSKIKTVSSGTHEIMLYFDIDNKNSNYHESTYYKKHQRHRRFRKRK